MSGGRTRRARALAVALAIVAVAGLSGCVETPGVLDARVAEEARAGRVVANPGVSPGAATVAFVAVEGAPPAVAARFTEKTTGEALRREMALVDAVAASYLVRGYLSAWPVEGGTSIGYVWDVFDRSRNRIRRSEDAITVKGSAADPWSLVNDQALTSLASHSADDLAAILTHTPEAIAARRPSAPAAAAIASSAPAPAPLASPQGLRAFR